MAWRVLRTMSASVPCHTLDSVLILVSQMSMTGLLWEGNRFLVGKQEEFGLGGFTVTIGRFPGNQRAAANSFRVDAEARTVQPWRKRRSLREQRDDRVHTCSAPS